MTATCSMTTVSPFSGEVASPYWQTLVEVVKGLDALELNMAFEEQKSVSVDQYLALFSRGLSISDTFGLKVGQAVTLGTFPVIGMTLLSCQNLKQALEQILRYEGLNHDLGVSKLMSNDTVSKYIWTPNNLYLPNAVDELSFQLALSIFSSIQTFIPWLIKRPLDIESVGFMVDAPQNIELYQNFFKAEMLFGQRSNFISVKNEVLEQKVIGGDNASFSALTAFADNLLGEDKQNTLVWRLRSVLPKALGKQKFRIEDLASQLNMSPRTLQRKLKDTGTKFQVVLDEVRKRLAEFYLLENRLSMSEIAFLVGYQEQSSFNHAFKHWNNVSPLEYRSGNM